MEKLQRIKRERGRKKRGREEEHRGCKRGGEDPEKRQLQPRIPAKYEEFNPEWENLEFWGKDGKIQNKKYSRIGQVRRPMDMREQGEGEGGCCTPEPPFLGKPRNLEYKA